MSVWSPVAAMLTVFVLAALRVSASPGPGCDNGKLYLERDLPEADLHWDCPASTWPAQRHLSIDTVYDPEPPSQVCMDQSISYNRSIPSSGAHRPIRAESGEYLYCPPQRWINNLHNSATVLLYHPCAPLWERRLLSVLARSCLSDYIITPHHQLSKHTLIALVSLAHTLELSTVATPDACDWLEATTRARHAFGGARPSTMYNHLLTWSAERRWRPGERSANMKGLVRRCCEEIISQSSMKAEAKSRSIRENPTSRARQETQTRSRVLGPSAGSPPGNGAAPTQTDIQNIGQGLRPVLGSKTLRAQSLGGAQRSRLRKPHPPLMSHDVNNSSREQAAESVRKEDAPRGQMKNNEVVDVKERELDQGSQRNPDPTTYPPSSAACGGCSAGHLCRCSEDLNPQPAEGGQGFPRTPRSDEAVWAAAALGFLLVLLTLSVLHTRLYRHWRTPPSLYWHDPQLDYDSVAEVIHRRLRIAKRRRKRGRRQECVLLPSSSSSDELP